MVKVGWMFVRGNKMFGFGAKFMRPFRFVIDSKAAGETGVVGSETDGLILTAAGLIVTEMAWTGVVEAASAI